MLHVYSLFVADLKHDILSIHAAFHCILWKPVFIIFIIESAPPEANSGICVGHAAIASVPSSYLRLCAAISCKS